MRETKMNHYLKLASIGFASTTCLSFLLRLYVSHGAWENQQTNIMGISLCLSGGYVATCSAFLSDLFTGKHPWATNPMMRLLGISLAGASFGLFLLSWKAILGPNELEFLYTHDYQRLLHGYGPEQVVQEARALVPKAQLLCMYKVFLENCVQYALFFAALAIANYWIYNIVSLRQLPSILSFVLRFFIPGLIIVRIVAQSLSPPKFNFF
jgi:hypothetical protein